MNDVDKMLVKQFPLRVRQEGYPLVENPPQSNGSELNINIYRCKTKICTFDDRQLGERWKLRVRTDDSTLAVKGGNIRGEIEFDLVDTGKIAMHPAVELFYLPPEQQQTLMATLNNFINGRKT